MKRFVLILGALTALGPLSIDMYLPALPALTKDLAAGPSLIQLTLTACLVGLALGQAVAGPLSDALGRRRPLLIGAIGYAVASALCVLAPTVHILIGLRLIQGAAGGTAIVIARAIVRDRYEGAAAARFFALLTQISGVAPIAAPLIGGAILRFTSWRGVFVLLAVVGLVLVLAVAGLPETLDRAQRQSGGLVAALRTVRELVGDRAFSGYTLSTGLAFAAMFAYISGSPFLVQDVYGRSPQVFSLVFAVNGAGIVAAGQLSGRLSALVGARPLFGAGLFTSLIGALVQLAAVLVGAGLFPVLAGLFLVVSGIGLTMPNGAALALSGQPPERAGTASALLGLAQFVIGGAAAPLVGAFGTHTAIPMAVVITVLASAAVLAAGTQLPRARGGTGRSGGRNCGRFRTSVDQDRVPRGRSSAASMAMRAPAATHSAVW